MAEDLEELRRRIAELTQRVYRLEQAAGIEARAAAPAEPSAPAPVPPITEQRTPPPPYPLAPPTSVPRRPQMAASTTADGASLESRIGSQWLNRIGIVAVLVGVSYFLKYAFENNWIGPTGRISIGLMAGIAVVLWSERFRARGYKLFSYSLKAVGIGTLYLSLWAAFQMYRLVPSEVAFAAMVLVTAFTAMLALTQDAEILAAFAVVGGYITPLLLSTGQNREVALFSYVALLNLATLVLVAFRPWMRLLVGSFVGSTGLYVAWYSEFYRREFLGLTIFFATLFFAVFAVAPLFVLRNPVKRLVEVPPTLIVIPLLNAAVYFLEVYVMLENVNKPATAWIAVGLAAGYLLLSRPLQKHAAEATSRLLNLLYIALAVGFLTTAIPLKLETHWITLGWLAESAVLLWIGYRVPTTPVKALATAALVLGVGRLLIFDNFHPAQLVFNARFATYAVAIAALGWGVSLARKGGSEFETEAAGVAIIAINVLAVFALSLEMNDYFMRQIQALEALHRRGPLPYAEWRYLSTARDFGYSAVWMVYGAALMCVGFWKRSAFLRWQALVLIAVTIVKVFIYDTSRLDRGYRIASFIGLGVLLLAISFIYQRDWLKLSGRGVKTDAASDQAKGSPA